MHLQIEMQAYFHIRVIVNVQTPYNYTWSVCAVFYDGEEVRRLRVTTVEK